MMSPRRRPADIRSTSPRDARAYASKAHEFLQAARSSLEAGNNVAAAGNAVHAGIAAADTIAAARAGSVWRGEHGRRQRTWRPPLERTGLRQPVSFVGSCR